MRRLSHVSASASLGGMKSRTSRSIVGAVLLSLLLAGQSMAATWATVPLTSYGNAYARGLATMGTSTAVAVYEDGGVMVRRSANSGATWKAALRLTSAGVHIQSAIAGRGSNVDVVWAKDMGDRTVIRYARSTTSGKTFRSSVRLSPKAASSWHPSVARGPNSRVVVAWTEMSASIAPSVRVRVSTDGGASFGKVKTLATLGFWSAPVVAVGKGAIYVAYDDASGVVVRRSTNSGSTWSSARLIAGDAQMTTATIAAEGSQAYVAYTATSGHVRYRRTTDKGATWVSPANLSATVGTEPTISLRGGVARAAFGSCLDEECTTSAVFYRQSSNGKTWTQAEMVSVPTYTPKASPCGVGYAGKVIVLYEGLSPAGPDWDRDVWASMR